MRQSPLDSRRYSCEKSHVLPALLGDGARSENWVLGTSTQNVAAFIRGLNVAQVNVGSQQGPRPLESADTWATRPECAMRDWRAAYVGASEHNLDVGLGLR